MPFAKIPKPDGDKGLGISWPAQETDMDALKAVFEDMKARLWKEGATLLDVALGWRRIWPMCYTLLLLRKSAWCEFVNYSIFLCASTHSLFLHSMNAMQRVKYNTLRILYRSCLFKQKVLVTGGVFFFLFPNSPRHPDFTRRTKPGDW